MKMRGSVVSLSFIFPHPPEDEKRGRKKKLSRHLEDLFKALLVQYLSLPSWRVYRHF